MFNKEEVLSMFHHYLNDKFAVVEGVMGFYDGVDRGFSSYDLAKALQLPVILVLNAKGSYSTISAILKGLKDYRQDNQIEGLILNHVSSKSHYLMIQKQIMLEHPDIKLLGWIPKLANAIPSRHLGLDLTFNDKKDFVELSDKLLENVNIHAILNDFYIKNVNTDKFENIFPANEEIVNFFKDKILTIVKDPAFSFLYYDNLKYFESIFKEVQLVSSEKNEKIDKTSNNIYLPGGYVETPENYDFLSQADIFTKSLKDVIKNGAKVYAECAGLLYLGESVETLDGKKLTMSQLLPLKFKMLEKRKRLGYYKGYDLLTHSLYKGHAFHYSDIKENDSSLSRLTLFKEHSNHADIAGWQKNHIYGTYLHTFFRNQNQIITNFFYNEA